MSEKQVWKSVIVFSVILIIVAIVGTYIYLNFFISTPFAEKNSYWEEDTYVNTALDLRFSLPEGWETVSDEELELLYAEQSDEESHEIVLFLAKNPGEGQIVLAVKHIGRALTDEELSKVLMLQSAYPNDYAYKYQPVEKTNLAGKQWVTMRMTSDTIPVESYQLAMSFEEYIVFIGVVDDAQENPIEYLQFFSSNNQ